MAWALVTGAGIRVGRAIALALAKEGFDIVLHAHRSVESLHEVSTTIEAMGRKTRMLRANLGSRAERDAWIQRVCSEIDTLDVLVNNAAIYESKPFESIDYDDWDTMLGLNLEAPFFVTRGVLPCLRQGERPVVINITDSGLDWPDSHYAHYFAAKAGLAMVTRVLALELAPEIRVNAVAPGTVAVPENFTSEQRAELFRHIPLGEQGAPSDIAQAVIYMVKHGSFVTGQSLAVDGGRSAW